MGAKLFVAALGFVLLLTMVPASSQAGSFEGNAGAAPYIRDRHIVRLFGPPSHYAPVVIRALFDSCWRYRPGRRPERIWTCDNYVKPNADLDWGYGASIADQAVRYGYR
jgi:hypothetical protein